MRRFFSIVLILALAAMAFPQINVSEAEAPAQPLTAVNHVFWIWFENRENTAITAATAPTFTTFASNGANFTNFFGVEHPSEPNYLDAFSGSNQGVTNDNHFTFTSSVDNLAKQLATAGKSWRVYAQDYPGSCSDVDTFTGGVDGPGVAGQYVRKHNPVISFENIRLDATQCSFVQPLANFDPSVNFAFIVPNMTNDMHDGTTAQGDAFLSAFLPQITGSADFAHTLLIVTFDEGSTSTNGGGHIYTAAGAPWLSGATVSATYNHFNMLRTTEGLFGLPFLGAAATATTINEILPPVSSSTFTISGRVHTSGGSSIRHVLVSLRDRNGSLRWTPVNQFGYYRFQNVTADQSYLISANSKEYTIKPISVGVASDVNNADLVP